MKSPALRGFFHSEVVRNNVQHGLPMKKAGFTPAFSSDQPLENRAAIFE
jgi:hypothetical protein